MAPNNVDPGIVAYGGDDYFAGGRGQESKKHQVSSNERYLDYTETPLDVGPTLDSHRGLLSESVLISDKGSSRPEEKSPVHQVADARWRPKWLRPIVLSIFLAIFVVFTVALPVMLWYSQNNSGLVQTRQSYVYLWRFGPTALLTMVSIFWGRVELQTLRYMPWIAHRRSQLLGTQTDVYNLDYTAMLSPMILFQSFRNKHYLVSCIAIVSLILKLQIVLAPGLYSLANVRVAEPTGVQLLDSFNTTTRTTQVTDGSAFYMFKALDSFNMRYPFGVTEDLAYQTFKFANGTARGSTDAPLSVVVDGYFSEMQCLKLEDYEASDPVVSSRDYYAYNVSLKFPGCDQRITSETDRIMWTDRLNKNAGSVGNWVMKMTVGKPCSNLPQQNNQSLYFATRLGPSASNSSQPAFIDFAGVLCTSTSWVSKVQVIDDGVSPKVTALSDEAKIPVVADLWNMLSLSMPESGGRWTTSGTGRVYGPVSSLTQIKGEALGTAVDVTNPALYTNDILYTAVMTMAHNFAPLLGHYRLRQEDESSPSSSGFTISSTDRLIVIQWVCIAMAALFAVQSIIIAAVLVRHTSRTAVWYRDPATVLGNMMFFRDHPDISDRIAHDTSGLATTTTDWSDCSSTPMVLKTSARAISTVFTLGVIFGLVFALRVSETQDGLATVPDDGYLHFVWTSLPALVMLSIAMYAGCCDSSYRALATFSNLSTRSCSAKEVDVSLLDMLGLRALFYSLKQRVWAVTLSQILAIICAFLTTLVSVVFTVQSIPQTSDIQLQQTTWFGATEIGRGLDGLNVARSNRQMISSLVSRQGEAALTYPKNTYDDLVFPVLGGLEDIPLSPNTTIRATIPAAKLHPVTCSKVPPSNYKVNVTSWTEETTYFQAAVTQPFTCPNGTQAELLDMLYPSAGTFLLGTSFVADIFKSPENVNDINMPCGMGLNASDYEYAPWRVQTYAWGEFSKEKKGFESLSVWKCNYTFVEVATEVTLAAENGAYVLDPEIAPKPDLSTIKPWSPSLDLPHVDGQFLSRDVGDSYPSLTIIDVLAGTIASQFKVLIKPYGRFPLVDLGNSNQDEGILQDLHHNYGLVSAQLVNIENRYNMTASSQTSPPPAGGLPALGTTVIDSSRRRLVQNAVVTYVLVAILSIVAAANIWALCSALSRRYVGRTWPFDMHVRGLAPDGFHSMAAMSALLRGSNAPDHLPENTELLSSDELHGRLADLNFSLGWFQRAMSQTKVFTVGVRGDSEFQFLGAKARKVGEQ
ncbi:hypothetical protein CkaCkLH20_11221 [Colletotrichum karsti]|uniref:Uncharacterized protein n=1 Tax=Colletotrichum karsti TaxID=1095194 RepID=A0A9P6I3K2_9PEZI|nr:uncharacterized protein CkaCkLH20_11221 [Colletotrichum karsti]KAF9871300.1 hypothetical protein CkaCkLH20_11221 [Colletotrichum karsti]